MLSHSSFHSTETPTRLFGPEQIASSYMTVYHISCRMVLVNLAFSLLAGRRYISFGTSRASGVDSQKQIRQLLRCTSTSRSTSSAALFS